MLALTALAVLLAPAVAGPQVFELRRIEADRLTMTVHSSTPLEVAVRELRATHGWLVHLETPRVSDLSERTVAFSYDRREPRAALEALVAAHNDPTAAFVATVAPCGLALCVRGVGERVGCGPRRG